MRARGALISMVLLLAACGGSTPSTSRSPSASAAASASAAVSTGSSPVPSPSASAGPASLVHCTATIPAGDNMVIGAVVGDPTVVVRDIQDPANAKTLCTFDAGAQQPQFVSASVVAYITPNSEIVEAQLAGGPATILATFTPGTIGSGQYAVSPDGRSISYLDQNSWHVAGPSGNRVLATLPAPAGRANIPDEDENFLAYSPDGQYIALFQTYRVGGGGATAPDQVRRASDGSVAYSTSGVTMAVWASVPSRLFFRDAASNVHRWDPANGLSAMTSLHWIRPQSSPDGRWIAYTFRTPSGLGGVGFYSVQSNSVAGMTPPGRSGVRFLSNDLVWYVGEQACSTCGGQPGPTGVTYIYSIAGTSEITSRLSTVYDAWPHQTAPGL